MARADASLRASEFAAAASAAALPQVEPAPASIFHSPRPARSLSSRMAQLRRGRLSAFLPAQDGSIFKPANSPEGLGLVEKRSPA